MRGVVGAARGRSVPALDRKAHTMIRKTHIWDRHNVRGYFAYLFLPVAVFLATVFVPWSFLFFTYQPSESRLPYGVLAIGIIPIVIAIPILFLQRKVIVADIYRRDTLRTGSIVLTALAYFGGLASDFFLFGFS